MLDPTDLLKTTTTYIDSSVTLRCSPFRMLVSRLLALLGMVGCAMCDGRAKAVGRRLVTGPGFSVDSRSSRHCLALCNKHPACDAANYRADKGKCRIITRCSPIRVGEDSPYSFYFAKRPGSEWQAVFRSPYLFTLGQGLTSVFPLQSRPRGSSTMLRATLASS